MATESDDWNPSEFKLWLEDVFRPFVREDYLGILIGNWETFAQAFTSREINPQDNYDLLEIIGDGVAAYVLPIYFYNRFPQLRNPSGVASIARLKIKYASKEIFSEFGRKLGFWPWIRKSKTIEVYPIREKSLLEDVFEAVLGAMVIVLDRHFGINGVGTSVGYVFMSKLLDDLNISLDYKDLFDAKTRLKELIDIFGSELGNLTYKNDTATTRLYLGQELIATVDENITRKQREQRASEIALTILNQRGYTRAAKA